MTHANHLYLSQAATEQRTGLSREVLRKWELRYQFPKPQRGSRGQRQYEASDIAKLHLIQRLLQHGFRVGSLVPQSTAQLRALLEASAPRQLSAPDSAAVKIAVQALLESLAPASEPAAVAQFLHAQITLRGLEKFVAHYLPAFNQAVGEAWRAQQVSVAHEHRYTEALRQVVLRAMPLPAHAMTRPRVLLTTPPGELHGIGLLALHAQLSLQGADCVNLDTQTPLADLLQAVQDLQVGVVAISVSLCLPALEARNYLQGLRQGLPETCELWVGGQGCAALGAEDLTGCQLFSGTTDAVLRWLGLSQAQRCDA